MDKWIYRISLTWTWTLDKIKLKCSRIGIILLRANLNSLISPQKPMRVLVKSLKLILIQVSFVNSSWQRTAIKEISVNSPMLLRTIPANIFMELVDAKKEKIVNFHIPFSMESKLICSSRKTKNFWYRRVLKQEQRISGATLTFISKTKQKLNEKQRFLKMLWFHRAFFKIRLRRSNHNLCHLRLKANRLHKRWVEYDRQLKQRYPQTKMAQTFSPTLVKIFLPK